MILREMEIRKATAADFETIMFLIQEFASFIRTPEKVSLTLDQMIRDRDYFQCLVVEENAVIVGFSTYFFAYYSWIGKTLYLDDLYVQEQHRGKGIGTKLFDAIVETAKKEGCKKVRWQVSNWNSNAISFYKNKGAFIDPVEVNCDLLLI